MGRSVNGRAQASAEQEEAAREMFERGDAIWYIAESIGYSASGLDGLARRRGWKRPDGYRDRLIGSYRWSPSATQLDLLKDMWSRGDTSYEMMAEFGVSWHAISRAAARHGLSTRSRRDLDNVRRQRPGRLGDAEARYAAVVKLSGAGVDLETIADHLGISVVRVRDFERRARDAGELVPYRRRPWSPTAEHAEIVSLGCRLGIQYRTMGWLIDMDQPIAPDTVRGFAKRKGYPHRNRFKLLTLLSPEQLLAAVRSGVNPADRAQILYRSTKVMTEAQALSALEDFRAALAAFPRLNDWMENLRPWPVRGALRPVSLLLERAGENWASEVGDAAKAA